MWLMMTRGLKGWWWEEEEFRAGKQGRAQEMCPETGNGAGVSDDPSSALTSPWDCPPPSPSSIVLSFLVFLQTSTAHPEAAGFQSRKSWGIVWVPGNTSQLSQENRPLPDYATWGE